MLAIGIIIAICFPSGIDTSFMNGMHLDNNNISTEFRQDNSFGIGLRAKLLF